MNRIDEGWEGLTLGSADCTGWSRKHELDLPHSTLLFHQQGGRAFSVHGSGSVWKFKVRSGRFDYYPAGLYESIVSGPASMRAIRIDIPCAFENSVLEEGHWTSEMSQRFQFQDRRLESIVLSMKRAGIIESATPDAVMLSVAMVDRLYEITNPTAKEDTAFEFTPTIKRLIVEYLDQYLSSSLQVDKVASLTGLARTQFTKLFRESFGAPLHRYVISRKIHIATRRLLDDVLVTDLSHELGFASHAHFSTVFKTYVGTTPSEYKKRHHSNGKECLSR